MGIAMVTGGFLLYSQLKKKLIGFKRAVGIVIDHAPQTSGLDPTPTYRPVVEYYVNQERFKITSSVGHGEKKQEGTGLNIWYNPANPADAVVADAYYFPAQMLLGIGGVFVLLGGLIAYHLLFDDAVR